MTTYTVRVASQDTIVDMTNYVIRFDDGSYIDLIQQAVHGEAAHRATIIPPLQPEKETKPRERTEKKRMFAAVGLVRIQNVPHARVHVKPTLKQEIKVKLKGYEDLVESVVCAERGPYISIHSLDAPPVSGGTSVMTVHRDTVTVSIGDDERVDETVEIEVHVPYNTALELRDSWLEAHIGDIKAPVQVISRCDKDVYIGEVKDASVYIADCGSVSIAKVNGHVDVVMTGSGNVTVDNGKAKTSDIILHGSGVFTFKGTASDVTLDHGSDKHCKISQVKGDLTVSLTADGNVKIDHIDVQDLDVTVGNVGSLLIKTGVAKEALLTSKGDGDIVFKGGVLSGLMMNVQGNGDVRVSRGNVDNLVISTLKDGDAFYGGRAMHGLLHAFSKGSINAKTMCGAMFLRVVDEGGVIIDRVENAAISAEIAGDGNIVLKDGIASDLRVVVKSDGNFNFSTGIADRAALTTLGDGDIIVRRVKKLSEKVEEGNGRVLIGNKK